MIGDHLTNLFSQKVLMTKTFSVWYKLQMRLQQYQQLKTQKYVSFPPKICLLVYEDILPKYFLTMNIIW